MKKNILVTACGSVLGLELIKTLKLTGRDLRLVGTDYFNNALGLYWTDQRYILPDVLNKNLVSEEKWLDAIIDIINLEKIEVVFIGIDFEVELFSKYKDEINKKTKTIVVVSDYETVMIGRDKKKTVDFLQNNGFPFPFSCIPSELDVFLQLRDFPFIVKPRFGNRSKLVQLVKNKQELLMTIERTPDPIIQEYLPGDDKEFTCGALFLNGKVLSIISLRRDLKLGNTFRAYSDEFPEIDSYIQTVTKALRPFGPINFQLRISQKGPVIFEINPRFSGTTSMRAVFGINEIDILLSHLFEENVLLPEPVKKRGVIMRYFENYFINFDEIKHLK